MKKRGALVVNSASLRGYRVSTERKGVNCEMNVGRPTSLSSFLGRRIPL